MSYDIWLEADIGDGKRLPLAALDWNYTSNCGPMWRAAGADLADFDMLPAGECTADLRSAINNMLADPDRFRAMNPENGWGSYDTLLPALCRLLAAFEEAPKAIVRVSR